MGSDRSSYKRGEFDRNTVTGEINFWDQQLGRYSDTTSRCYKTSVTQGSPSLEKPSLVSKALDLEAGDPVSN